MDGFIIFHIVWSSFIVLLFLVCCGIGCIYSKKQGRYPTVIRSGPINRNAAPVRVVVHRNEPLHRIGVDQNRQYGVGVHNGVQNGSAFSSMTNNRNQIANRDTVVNIDSCNTTHTVVHDHLPTYSEAMGIQNDKISDGNVKHRSEVTFDIGDSDIISETDRSDVVESKDSNNNHKNSEDN